MWTWPHSNARPKSGDVRLDTIGKNTKGISVYFLMDVVSRFALCHSEKKKLQTPKRYVLAAMSADWICSVHWLRCSLLAVALLKTALFALKGRSGALRLARCFFLFLSSKSTSSLLMSESTKNEANVTQCWSRNRRHGCNYKWNSPPPPPSLSVYTAPITWTHAHAHEHEYTHFSHSLSFSVDKRSQSLTTRPGKIAQSHTARQVYPWPGFPLTTFPSSSEVKHI